MRKEEILEKHGLQNWGAIEGQFESALNAMQEYADQQTKELQERVDELKQIGVESIKIAEDLSLLKKKYENRAEHLQSRIDELEKANDSLKEAFKRSSELIDKLKFD